LLLILELVQVDTELLHKLLIKIKKLKFKFSILVINLMIKKQLLLFFLEMISILLLLIVMHFKNMLKF